MVDVVVKTTTEVTLVLQENEVTWLKRVLQNPIMEIEEPGDSAMRHSLFNALPKVDKL